MTDSHGASNQNRMSPPLMTGKDVCRYLGISRRTLLRLMKKQELPAFRVGRGLRFRRQDVEAWLAGCQLGSPNGKGD